MTMKFNAKPSKDEFVKMCREAVNKVVEHGYASVKIIDDIPQCSYYNDSGSSLSRCVVGHLMEEETAKSVDGEGAIGNLIDMKLWGFNLDINQQNLLINLQDAHDTCEDYDEHNTLKPLSENFKMQCDKYIDDYESGAHEYN